MGKSIILASYPTTRALPAAPDWCVRAVSCTVRRDRAQMGPLMVVTNVLIIMAMVITMIGV